MLGKAFYLKTNQRASIGCPLTLCMHLLAPDIRVDGSGGLLAGAHRLDDGGRTGDGVAAGEHAVLHGGHGVVLNDDAAAIAVLEVRRRLAQQRVGGRCPAP